MLRVLPKSEVRETHCRVREKSGKSFLEAWGWTMKIGLDLDIARKGIPGEEVVWERYRGRKPWECSGNNMGESYVRQPLHGYIRQHQAELTEGSKFRKFIFAFWEELRKISQNKSISPILGFLRKTAKKTYPDVTALLSNFGFSQSQCFLEVSFGLDHASLEEMQLLLFMPQLSVQDSHLLLLTCHLH